MRTRRKNNAVFLILLALIVLLAVGGVGITLSYRTTPLDLRNADRNDSRAAVRAWLHEHTKSGKWEEVRWWPEAEYQDGKSTRRFIKLRWRSQNSFGGPAIANTVFEIRRGKVVGTDAQDDGLDVSDEALAKMFPDSR